MARVERNTVSYFPHDANASNGDTLTVIQSQFGNNGYALWFKLLEKLAHTENHYIDCNNRQRWKLLVAYLGTDEITTVDILKLLVEMQAIDKDLWESKLIWCQNLVDNLADVYKNRKREKPNKPIIIDKNAINTPKKDIATSGNTQSKVKESKVKESKVIRDELLAPFSPEFQKVFNHFIEMRQMIRRPMTDRAIELAFLNLDKLASTEAGKIEILNQSIVNSWQGLFPIDKRKEVNRVGAKQQQPKRFEGHQHIIAGTDEE